jgi:hypothetical protein
VCGENTIPYIPVIFMERKSIGKENGKMINRNN